MTTELINTHRAGADVVKGDAECKVKSVQLLEEFCVPNGLFALENIEEYGFNKDAGFVWLIQKKKVEYNFKKAKQLVSYGTEVTAFVEKGKMTKITGVKTRELLLWLSVVEVYTEESKKEKVTIKTGTGLSDTFDFSAFEL